MKLRPAYRWCWAWFFLMAAATAQVAPANAPTGSAPPVPYSSVSELNLLLSQLEQVAQTTQVDLAKLRIEKWKTDAGTKHGTQDDVESLQRNLQRALPEIVGQLKASPENIEVTFKLYRNLDALYDVFGPVVESAGAFGTKDEFQSLQNDLSSIERSRHALAERMENLGNAKEAELAHLRAQVRDLQAAAPAPAPVKKIVVDDTEPPKKPVKKKPVPRPPKATTPASPQTPSGSTSTQPPPQSQTPQP